MNVTAQKFQSLYALVRKSLAQSNHRPTLPQSALRAASSLREGAGERPPHNVNHPPAGCFFSGRVIFGFVWGDVLPFNRVLAKPWGWRAIFIAPTKLRMFWFLPFNGRHSLSLAFARQLPQRGSREGRVPFIVPPGNRKGAGDFHRPYEGSEDFTFHFFILPGLWLWQVCCGAGG